MRGWSNVQLSILLFPSLRLYMLLPRSLGRQRVYQQHIALVIRNRKSIHNCAMTLKEARRFAPLIPGKAADGAPSLMGIVFDVDGTLCEYVSWRLVSWVFVFYSSLLVSTPKVFYPLSKLPSFSIRSFILYWGLRISFPSFLLHFSNIEDCLVNSTCMLSLFCSVSHMMRFVVQCLHDDTTIALPFSSSSFALEI